MVPLKKHNFDSLQVKVSFQNPPELKMNGCPTCITPQCLLSQETLVFTWEVEALHVGKYTSKLAPHLNYEL